MLELTAFLKVLWTSYIERRTTETRLIGTGVHTGNDLLQCGNRMNGNNVMLIKF